MKKNSCPNCFQHITEAFYSTEKTPVNSMIHVLSRKEALVFPEGAINLMCCLGCGLIFNAAFKSYLTEYSDRYDSTQRHSGVFSQFNQALAEELVEKHKLKNKKIIEIGCGEGEFLYLLCQAGNNRGIGFDPAYRESSLALDNDVKVTFIPEYFSEKFAQYQADYCVCKMTLEHIQDVTKFLSMMRETLGKNDPTFFFQVPNFEKSLKEGAFWDVYYEHCSYFTSESLKNCFENAGFFVADQWVSFQDNYLMIEAVPLNASRKNEKLPGGENTNTDLVKSFQFLTSELREAWSRKLSTGEQSGERIVIWGASSKGVSFLTTLETRNSIKYAVDINPNKRGKFVPCSGQEIVGPQDMPVIRPDTVIVMNPVYTEEIKGTLMAMDLFPAILSVEHPY
jgi:ubiquinone/menaquinone biosynthesis C-methylase UbiE